MNHLLTSAALVALLAAATAQAGISHATVTPPGGYAQAASHLDTSGGSLLPGGDLMTYQSPDNAQEAAFAGNSAASADASASSGSISNSSHATYGMGFATMHATNTCPNSTFFAMASTNGGWKERFTVSSATLNGTAGYMVFQVRVQGVIDVSGFAGSASINTTGYKDTTELGLNAYFNRGPSDAISTDRQRTQWALSSFGQPDSRTFDGIVTMSVPITFGQPFNLGVYATARAGQRSSSGVGGNSTGTVNGTVSWAGVTSVITSNGTPVADYAISNAAPVDWTQPWTPCGTSDFNGDGDAGTDADIEAFFACLGGSCCPTCWYNGADFNGDGDAGTDADIEAFFRVLGGGAC